ncbi:hypothetical protein DE146DRAFT_478613 [Phaeosphaeria sp. MPI-PUGE-AT-0046c]|nr:hypothetical protein DE146DRAFT_478613 [Phaeosphaeria sp. MPI-PUGE-AT-0046c]
MPPRIKSCLNCRIARAKCSLANPCLRCLTRNLECQYPLSQSSGSGNRRIRIIKPALSPYTRSGKSCPVSFEATHLEANSSTVVASTTTPVPECIWTETADNSRTRLIGPSQPNHASPSSSLSHHRPENWPVEASTERPLSPSWFAGLDLTSASRISDEIGRLDAFTQLAMPHQSASSNIEAMEVQLSRRTRSLQQGSLAAKMVFSRLSDYTRMLAEGKELPPFIYPPCCTIQDNQCLSGLPHQCLPETLAVCANLARIFHNCEPESRGYAWHQVRLHIQRLYADFEGDNVQRQLEAMQAVMVYGMLCAQFEEYVPRDDAAWLVATMETFGYTLYPLCLWVLSAIHVCSSRNEWILMESMRRIVCLIYFYDLLLQTKWQGPSSGECPDFFSMPLPCSRELWQKRMSLTFEHLFSARRAYLRGVIVASDLTNEIAEWCEKADDLSVLLWIAHTVEGEGQAPGLSRIP